MFVFLTCLKKIIIFQSFDTNHRLLTSLCVNESRNLVFCKWKIPWVIVVHIAAGHETCAVHSAHSLSSQRRALRPKPVSLRVTCNGHWAIHMMSFLMQFDNDILHSATLSKPRAQVNENIQRYSSCHIADSCMFIRNCYEYVAKTFFFAMCAIWNRTTSNMNPFGIFHWVSFVCNDFSPCLYVYN